MYTSACIVSLHAACRALGIPPTGAKVDVEGGTMGAAAQLPPLRMPLVHHVALGNGDEVGLKVRLTTTHEPTAVTP